jgi:parallel beta-helix repeat protein
MRERWAAFTLLLMAGVCLTAAAEQTNRRPATFYVATNGNDQWSGRLATPTPDRTDGPFASVGRAREALRRAPGGCAQIRAGVYYLSEPLTFGPDDSGTPQSPTSLVAYPGEKPELVGARPITGWQRGADRTLSVELADVRAGKWYFRQLFVDGQRQIRARYPNADPADSYRKGFMYVARGLGGFGLAVGNIHNRGDWMDYVIRVPADGEYRFWVYYGALNKPFGRGDMGGRTSIAVDGGKPVPLMNLPDTGGWGDFRWSQTATLPLTQGQHRLRWQNMAGGGLQLEAYALTDDPQWKPTDTRLPKPAPGKHLLVIQAEEFAAYQGKQLSVSGSGGSKNAFHYDPATFKPRWAAAPGAEIHIFQSGSCRAFKEILSIVNVDPESRSVTVGGPECMAPLGPGDRYFVENVAEELDSPGEWHLDRATGVLRYRPAPGFSSRSEVTAPRVGRAIQILGDPAKKRPVRWVRIAGLTIRDTDYAPTDGCAGYGMGNDGAVYLADAEQCVIENCTLRNTGKYAVCLDGGRENTVRANEIAHSAEGGVLLLKSAGNTVSDNHIHHLGAVYKHIGGVVLEGAGTDDNRVAHNWIHDSSRYGISLKNPGRRNVIEYNRVERTNTETYDTGGIEVTQGNRDFRSGSAIHHNVVGDTIGYSSRGAEPVYLSWSIYLDSFAGGYDVHHNIVYRDHDGGIMLQGGRHNRVTNNIFVDGELRQGCLSNFAQNSTGLVLQRNIFCYSKPEATLFSTGKLSPGVIAVDYNLYWHGGAEIRTGWGARQTLAQWREQGYDRNSIVADPRFVDPKRDNYALQPDSPALRLGFQPIDAGQAGPRRLRP